MSKTTFIDFEIKFYGEQGSNRHLQPDFIRHQETGEQLSKVIHIVFTKHKDADQNKFSYIMKDISGFLSKCMF